MPSTGVSMLEGSLAAMGATTVSNPFEVVKTRLQLQGELTAKSATQRHYRGTLHGLYVIISHEGLSAVYKGYPAALTYGFVMNGVRLGLYEDGKAFTARWMGGTGLAANVSAGAMTGFLGNWISSPIFLVKTRQQAASASATIQVGTQHKYTGLLHGLSDIMREKGVRGLWHGSLMGACRTAVGSGVQLGSYDLCKPLTAKWTGWDDAYVGVHVVSSLLSSFIVAACMNPFDVVMTRIYTAHERQYSANFLASFAKIARVEGIRGLFKGSGALWSRIGPHTICTFVLLERIRLLRIQYLPWMDTEH